MIPINDKEEKTVTEEKTETGPVNSAEQQNPETPAEETEVASGVTEEGSEPEESGELDSASEESGIKAALKNRKLKKEEKKAEKEVEKLKKELADKDGEMALLNDKYLRICAEYDNFRKRSQKEKDSLYGDIRSNVITGFLPVYDNLERALAAHTEDEAYAKGVEMIMNQFNKTLEKLGVEEIPSLGETFDPAVHNAVMHVDDETKGENEIVEVFQKGFRIGDKIIRFAMVKVAN